MSGESCDSSDEMDTKESINGRAASRKKKSKRHKGVVTCPPGALQAGPAWGMLMLGIYRMVTGLLGHSGICVCIRNAKGLVTCKSAGTWSQELYLHKGRAWGMKSKPESSLLLANIPQPWKTNTAIPEL